MSLTDTVIKNSKLKDKNMKKLTIVLIGVFFILSTFTFSFADDFTFRNNIKWGMSKDEVKKREKAEFFKEDENSLIYTDTIFEVLMSISYNFHNNKLFSVLHLSFYELTNKESVNAYNKITADLSNKYGKPKELKSSDGRELQWTIGKTEMIVKIMSEMKSGFIVYSNSEMAKEANQKK